MISQNRITKTKWLNNLQISKWILVILGLFILALGVSLSVKADLGVSPISCVPYVYSLVIPFSFGEVTIVFNAIFVLLQIAILRKKYKYIQLIQFIAVIVLGYFIDFTYYLISGINPTTYFWQLAALLLSCVLVALGIFLFVKAGITYIPGDGLVVVISEYINKEFGKIKVCFDSSMVIIGIISSFAFLHELAGVREGTIIAALSVGILVQIFDKITNNLLELRNNVQTSSMAPHPDQNAATQPHVITISREYGSGGHELGQCIANKLGFSFYDKELINITADKSGFTKGYIRDNEQKIANTLFHELYAQNYAYVNGQLPPTDALFLIQSKIIRGICGEEPCVVVGRCANFVLKDNPNCFNIYVHANNEFRKSRLISTDETKAAIADSDLEQSDRERSNYCKKYTGRDWRDSTNYHVTIDSSMFTIEQLADNIIYMLSKMAYKHLPLPAE